MSDERHPRRRPWSLEVNPLSTNGTPKCKYYIIYHMFVILLNFILTGFHWTKADDSKFHNG